MDLGLRIKDGFGKAYHNVGEISLVFDFLWSLFVPYLLSSPIPRSARIHYPTGSSTLLLYKAKKEFIIFTAFVGQ